MRKTTKDTNCSNCAHWMLTNRKDKHGVCRRYPPVIVAGNESEFVAQPGTVDTDTCGEWKAGQ